MSVSHLCRAGVFLGTVCIAAGACAQSPASLDPPAGAHLLLAVQGKGTQVYTCADGHWALKAPDAKLFDKDGKEIGTHFAGPTWKLTDGSEVKGKAIATQPSPDASSVPWLLLEAVPGSASGSLASVVWILRTHTQGGKAPAQACTEGTLPVPYTADYSFYTK